MLDILSKVVAFIAAVIEAGRAAYNAAPKGVRGRKQTYYDKLLKPFLLEYKANKNLCTSQFVMSKVTRDDDNIPKYVFYLIDEINRKREEILALQDNKEKQEDNIDNIINNIANIVIKEDDVKLRKVLIDDYLNLFSNEYNKKRDLFTIVQKVLGYSLFLLAFPFIFIGALLIVNELISVISCLCVEGGADAINWLHSLLVVLNGLVVSFIGLIPINISERLSNDMYTTKKKRILKLITQKVNRYDKHFDEYII